MQNYDPDYADLQVENVSAEEFAIRLARYIEEYPHSQFQGAVANAFAHLDPFGVEWSAAQKLIQRIAELPLPDNATEPQS